MAFDFTLGSYRVQKSSNCLLQNFRGRVSASSELKICAGGSNRTVDATLSVWATDWTPLTWRRRVATRPDCLEPPTMRACRRALEEDLAADSMAVSTRIA